jgi:hypothetical protein
MKRLILLSAAVTAVIMISLPGFAQSSYTWALVCKGAAAPPSLGVGTGASWVWLHNGVQISPYTPPNGFASCATPPLSGSGVIPASINGIEVNGIAVTLSLSESPAGCEAFASVTKSFDPSNPKISISASVSAPAKNGFFYGNAPCPKASFHFSLSN